MRILTLSDLYPPHYVGGYELRCKETADEMASRGHELVVLTSWWGLDKPAIENNVYRILNIDPTRNLKSHNGKVNESRLIKRVNQLRWTYLCRQNYTTTRDILSTFKPDVVYIWNLCHLGINPVLAAQDLGIPTIFTLGIDWLYTLKNELFRDPSYLKRKFRQINNGLYDFNRVDTSHLITISQALKQAYVENGFPEQNITVIPRGLPSKMILEHNSNRRLSADGKVHLIFVGRLCAEKAPDDVIKAIANLNGKIGDHEILLDIVGTGQEQYIDELKTLAVSLKLENNIRFLGWRDHNEILTIFPTYDALVFPSRWEEPLGVVALEAMARDLPVIATNRGGIPEMIVDGQNGLLIPADDPEAMANAIRRIVEEEGLAEKLSAAANRTIRQKYALDVIVDRVMNYFQDVLAENPASDPAMPIGVTGSTKTN